MVAPSASPVFASTAGHRRSQLIWLEGGTAMDNKGLQLTDVTAALNAAEQRSLFEVDYECLNYTFFNSFKKKSSLV